MSHERYGDKLFESLWDGSQPVRRAVLILPAVLFLSVCLAIIYRHIWHFDQDTTTIVFFGILSVILCIFIVYVAFFSVKGYDAIVFERGLRFKRGLKTVEWSFDDLEGILNMSGDYISKPLQQKLIYIFPHKGHGETFTIGSWLDYPRVKMFEEFAAVLCQAHTDYLMDRLKGSSPEISFGVYLSLVGNTLVHKPLLEDQVAYPLESFRAIDNQNDANGRIMLLFDNPEGGVVYLEIDATIMLNIDTLYRLRDEQSIAPTI